MLYALVLAGGSGTRLWPYSRSHHPKQFLHLGDRHTMLQETIARTLPVIPLERLFIATGAAYVPLVDEQVQDLPRENLIVEPSGRGTAASIGLAALQIRRRDPDAVMVVVSADHQIANIDCYRATLTFGARLAAQGHLVAVGLEPTGPHPGYGYIELGDRLDQEGDLLAYKVVTFHEKPDAARAAAYIAAGRHLWNAGIFAWSADRILQELGKYQPSVMYSLELIDTYISQDGKGSPEGAAHIWSMLEHSSIDVAVMEHTDHAVVIPASLNRQDVGDCNAVYEAQPHDDTGNVVVGQHVGMATKQTLIHAGKRVVTTIGLEDFVVVDTDDAVLICPRDRAQDVKTLVTLLHHQHKHMV